MATNPDTRSKTSGSSSEGSAPTIEAVPAAGGKSSDVPRKYLGKYKFEKTLGAGGMGTVYLATDMELRRQVALKILPKDKAENERLVKRFKSEAQAAAKFKHDNIVAVYDYGSIDGQFFIALEYVDGTDAHQLVARRGVVPVKRSIEIITQAATALKVAWDQRVVHRDIKPSNLLIRKDGLVKLADLGLARSIDETVETGITRAGTTVGTVDYMSPEQARDSKAADIRSDIYSLGCTWYHLLTGTCPYPDGAMTNKLNAHANKPIPDPRSVNHNIPDGVIAVLNRMMAKKPEDRYQTPDELLEDLQHATLSRETVSDSLLAALAEDHVEESPKKSRSGEKPRPDESSTPKGRRKAAVDDEDDAPAPRLARRKETPPPEDDDSPAPRLQRRKSAPADEDEEVATPRLSRRSSSESSSSSAQALPPRETADGGGSRKKRTLDDVADEPKRGIDLDSKGLMRYLPAVALVLAILGIGGYVATRIGSALDTRAGGGNPFAGGSNSTNVPTEDPEVVEGPGKAAVAPTDDGKTKKTQPDPNTTTQTKPANNPGTKPATTPGTNKTAPPGGDPATPLKVEIGREAERDQIPVWVAGLPSLAEVADKKSLGPLASFKVGRDGEKPGDYPTLAEALDAVSKDGAMIRLHGPGPFLLRPKNVAGKGRLVLAAAGKTQPVIILQPERSGRGSRVLQLNGTSLELIGVHLVAVAGQFTDPGEVTLVDVSSGDLSVRQSTVTILGSRETPVTAFRAGGDAVRPDRKPANSARVLLDRVFGRGQPLCLLSVAQSATDLVVSNCAAASETGPVIRLLESPTLKLPPAAPEAGAPGSKTTAAAPKNARAETRITRVLRFFSCSFVSRGPVFDLHPKDPALPIAGASLTVMNSILGTDGVNDAAGPFVELKGWPPEAGGARPGFQDLSLDIPSTILAGWKKYVGADIDAARLISGASSWDLVWRMTSLSGQFSTRPWPGQPLTDFATVTPADLDASSIAAIGIKAIGGGNPGADVTVFEMPPGEYIARGEGLARRPVDLPIVSPPKEGEAPVVTFDATRDDVGKAISNGTWADGSTLRITGSGQRKSSPIVIKGKSARIEFDDGGLVLELDYKSSADAFINVAEGNVEIANGRFRIAASQQGNIPKWFLSVANGSFALEACYVAGPMVAGPRYEGLIRWTRPGDPAVKPLPLGHYENYGRLTNCYLASFGRFLIADLRGRGFSMSNTVAVSLDDAFDLNITGTDKRIAAAIDLRDSTISCAGTEFFRVKAASYSDPATDPLRFFVDRSVFLSAVDPGNGQVPKPYFLSYTGPLRDQKQVDWWGIDNGYGEIRQWLRGDNDPPAEGLIVEEGWVRPWGAGHELRPLSGKGAVLARGGFKSRSKIAPSDFSVDPSSMAAKWNPAGGPIGADVAPLDEPEKGSSGTDKEKGSKKNNKSAFPRPNF